MIKVVAREGQSVDDLLKIFKKKCQKERIIQEYRARRYYVKPSEKKRLARKERLKIVRKEQKLRNK